MGAKQDKEATFHGPFVRDRGEGRGVRVSTVKAQDLSQIEPGGAISPQEAGKLAKGRRTKLACLGIPKAVLEAGSPEYARCVRLANAYKKARTKELFEAHGHVSSGASALLAAASLALAASRFLYEIASTGGESYGISMPQLLKLASSLSDSARQNELSCWELCAREAVIRKRNEANNVAVPWLTGEAGQERRKPGRPRKVQALPSQVEDSHARQHSTVIDSSGSESHGDGEGTAAGLLGSSGRGTDSTS